MGRPSALSLANGTTATASAARTNATNLTNSAKSPTCPPRANQAAKGSTKLNTVNRKIAVVNKVRKKLLSKTRFLSPSTF